MKKPFRGIIWTLGLGVLLFAVFILAVNLYVQSTGVQNRIRQALGDALGLPVGVFRTTFSPWGGFRLDQINIASDNPKLRVDFLKANFLEVRCELLSLLQGRVVVKRIALDAPEFVFQKNAQGHFRLPRKRSAAIPPPATAVRTPPPPNPPALPDAARTTREQPSPTASATRIPEVAGSGKSTLPAADIRKLLMREGSFRFLAQDGSELFRMEAVRFSLNGRAVANSFEGVLAIKRAVILDRWLMTNLKSSVTLENGKLRIEKLSGELGGGHFDASAEADLTSDGQPYSLRSRLSKAALGQFFPKDSEYARELQGVVLARLDYDGFATQEEKNKGHAEVKVSRATISNLPMLQLIGQLVRSNEFGDLTIKKTEIKADIVGPVVKIVPSYLESDHLSVNFEGQINTGQKLDLKAQLRMDEALFKKLPNEAKENFVKNTDLDRQTLDFVVNGSIPEPQSNFVNRLIGDKLQKKLRHFLGSEDDEKIATPKPSPKNESAMRVVSGVAGGIPLQIPKHELRPTMDKVKGAIFSSLGELVIGARVLDLFAGSGALGIEALSRGAAVATLVESHPKTVDTISENLRKTRLTAAVCREDVFRFLKRNTEQFDLIFADPPYAKTADDIDFGDQLLHSAELLNALAPDGIFILERHPGGPLLAAARFRLIRQKRYGASEVLLLGHLEP